MGNKWKLILLLGVVAAAVFLRFYLLGSIPAGLTNDEADIGYDAYSLLVTGRDQWGVFLPLASFQGFGDFRLPLYTYLVVPAVKFFGLTAFAVRFPSAIFGIASVVLIYFLCKKLFEKEHNAQLISVFAAFLMAFSPWAIGISRIGIESNVAIALFLFALLLFLNGLKKKKLFAGAALFFAGTLYTYTSYTLFTPLSMVALFILYKKELLMQKRYFFAYLLLFTLVVSFLFLSRSTAGVRFSQISFINSQDTVGIMANLNDIRGSCAEKIPGSVCRFVFNKEWIFASTFIRNYISHFSANFVYLNGTTTQYSILPSRSLFYTVELLFFITGILKVLRKRTKENILLLILLLLSPLPDSATGEGHYSRASVMIPFLILVEAIGLGVLWEKLVLAKSMLRRAVGCAVCKELERYY